MTNAYRKGIGFAGIKLVIAASTDHSQGSAQSYLSSYIHFSSPTYIRPLRGITRGLLKS